MLKAKSLYDIKMSPYANFHYENFMNQITRYEKKMMNLKVIAHLIPKDLVVFPGSEIKIGWKIQNSGSIDWPEGSALMWRSGTIKSEHMFINPLKAGEIWDLSFIVKCPQEQGMHNGVWEAVIRGIMVSKLKAKIAVACDALKNKQSFE